MTFRRLPLYAILGVLAAALCARAEDPSGVQDDAQLFDKETAREAGIELGKIGRDYGVVFFLKTEEKPPEDKQKQLREAKSDKVQEDRILQEWAQDSREASAKGVGEDGGKAVYILVCKDAVERSVGWWKTTYGCVVIYVPVALRSEKFTEADARTLHNQLRWFKRGNARKNDAILLSAVARVRDDLYYNHLPPFPWLTVGGVMAGALGLWGALGLVRMRLRAADRVAADALRKKADFSDAGTAPPEAQQPGLFAALLGGMFGGAAGHWIYDTLFVAASRAAPDEPPQPAADEKKEAVQVEAPEPPLPTRAERLDLAARDHPTEEEPTGPGPARF